MIVQESSPRVQYKSLVQESSTRVQYKRPVQEFSPRVQSKSPVQESCTRVQYKSSVQESSTRVQSRSTSEGVQSKSAIGKSSPTLLETNPVHILHQKIKSNPHFTLRPTLLVTSVITVELDSMVTDTYDNCM